METATPKTSPTAGSRPLDQEAPHDFIVSHADWILPWLWRRRAVQPHFVSNMTISWLLTTYGRYGKPKKSHPVYVLVSKHTSSAFEVFHDFFKFVFVHQVVHQSASLPRLKELFKFVMTLALLLAEQDPKVLSQQFVMLTIRCCINSVASDWISTDDL
ncbi:hypothetical protein EX30DRAFT_227509 [Ascodesmis nigricans]|uniref:Uncharacterized protein n=1 Tax=Ascodesmis nigricans TaxID=341454 RepID=A0A4V3SHN0_9PEZI|nr:hypothetical protein EX30DRAFT_227509 [Ascodesmis nigricans]